MMQQAHDTAPSDRLMHLVTDVLERDPNPRAAVVCLVSVAGAMAEYLSENERTAIAEAMYDAADAMLPTTDEFITLRRKRRYALYLRRKQWRQLH